MGRAFAVVFWSWLWQSRAALPEVCSVDDGQSTCGLDAAASKRCSQLGFDAAVLRCTTCDTLKLRIEEKGGKGAAMVEECFGCCNNETKVTERFDVARLVTDAAQQDRDQDLHDFIKRKAPLFPTLEVEYQEDCEPGIELENHDDPNRVVRADIVGWKSEHLYQFLSERLETQAEDKLEAKRRTIGPEGAWTAEVQSCSGWRLNQLPEVRRFIKDPGHADTYRGLKINFIPHHNPDLVFFNEHGKEIERLDLGEFTCDQIHTLIQEKGFEKKQTKQYRAEIRTCSGWRLNQLPDVRRFIKEPGNANMYIGIKINYIPSHHPFLIMLGKDGSELDRVDLAELDFKGLEDLFASKGFHRKEIV